MEKGHSQTPITQPPPPTHTLTCHILRVGRRARAAAVDVGGNEVNLFAVFVGDRGASGRPRVGAEDDAALGKCVWGGGGVRVCVCWCQCECFDRVLPSRGDQQTRRPSPMRAWLCVGGGRPFAVACLWLPATRTRCRARSNSSVALGTRCLAGRRGRATTLRTRDPLEPKRVAPSLRTPASHTHALLPTLNTPHTHVKQQPRNRGPRLLQPGRDNAARLERRVARAQVELEAGLRHGGGFVCVLCACVCAATGRTRLKMKTRQECETKKKTLSPTFSFGAAPASLRCPPSLSPATACLQPHPSCAPCALAAPQCAPPRPARVAATPDATVSGECGGVSVLPARLCEGQEHALCANVGECGQKGRTHTLPPTPPLSVDLHPSCRRRHDPAPPPQRPGHPALRHHGLFRAFR